jgi:hypothetical protein
MNDHILQNSIRIIRNLMEEGMVVGTGGFTGSADPKGPVAGFDPMIGSPDGRSRLMRRLPKEYSKLLRKNKKKRKS